MYTSPESVSFLCGFFFFLILFGFVFCYLQCTFVTSDLCIVLSLYEKRKGKKKNTTGIALLKVLIWILFLYPNDVYFAFCKLKLNEICKNV